MRSETPAAAAGADSIRDGLINEPLAPTGPDMSVLVLVFRHLFCHLAVASRTIRCNNGQNNNVSDAGQVQVGSQKENDTRASNGAGTKKKNDLLTDL